MSSQPSDPAAGQGRPLEVLGAFLKLGLTSFGGPIAHLGYFRSEFVERRRWLDETAYADLVALCQFLPGPASSQVGFALGLMRAGPLGGLAAWTGFTLPSALLMFAFAQAAAAFALPAGLVHGLKLVAVAIVAQAVLGMALSLAPDARRASIAVAAAGLLGFVGGGAAQLGAIVLGALAGLLLCRGPGSPLAGRLSGGVGERVAVACLLVFFALLLGLPALAAAGGSQGLRLFEAFYRSGALVFGGGHVVLPLLQAQVVDTGWVGADTFLAGYGAAQAVPGPLFTFAAYLGAVTGPPPNGAAGALIALVGVFLPGLLLVAGMLPFWDRVRAVPIAQSALRGANAAVVGVLAAALYDPVFTSAVRGPADFAVAAAGFVALVSWKAPPWAVVLSVTAAGWLAMALIPASQALP